MSLVRLEAVLDRILRFERVANPSYREGTQKGVHRIGKGSERTIRIRDIRSPQATVHGPSVKAIARKKNGVGKMPTVQHRGHGVYVVHDGNHRIAAAIRNGKRTIRVLAQK